MPADVSLTGIEFEIRGSANSASNSIKNLTRNIDKLNATFARSKSIGSLSSQIRQIGDSAKAASKHTSNFASSILRIAKYRVIRGALKAVTSAFQEGLKNAYQFSKINGGALAESLDLIATKSLTMKNQLGAAFGALITAVTPIVLQLISLITRLANALSMLFAALGGQAQYKKAVDVWTEWGEAAGGAGAAAKEALKYLAPFDELNRLPDDKQGGGGGGAATPDFSEMFEYTDLPEWLQHFADKMSELASSLKITFNDVFFDWSDLTGEQIAEKAIVGLSALVGAGVGFMIGGVPGAIVGTLLGAAIGLEISAMTFDHDGVLSRSEIASMVSIALSALCGGVIGFVVGGPGGALIGAAIGIGISGGLKAVEFFSDGSVGNLVEQFATALTILTGAVIGFTVGGPAGALIGAAIGIGVSAAITGVEFSTSGQGSGWQGINYFVTEVLGMPTDEEWKQYGRNIWNWIVEGFTDFVGELKTIFVDPIVNAFEDFSFKDIIGGSDSSGEGGGLSDVFGGKLDIEATITGIVDKIPGAQKVIDGVKGIFGSTDKGADLSATDKTIDAQANLTTYQRNFKSGATVPNGAIPLLTSSANFTQYQKHFKSGASSSGVTPILSTIADFYNYQRHFKSNASSSGATPIISSIVDFYKYQKHFTSGASSSGVTPVISSIADFYKRVTSGNFSTTFNSNANFTKGAWSPNLGYYDKALNVNAAMKDPYWANGTPTMTVYAAMSYTNNPGYVMGGSTGGIWSAKGKIADIPQYASGGRVHGSIFLAGEAGAELVGHVGGRTEVLNRSQLASTMYAAVRSAMSGIAFNLASPTMGTGTADDGANEDMLYHAFLRALNDADMDDRPIELDGNVLYHSMVNRNRQNTRLTGVNAMA